MRKLVIYLINLYQKTPSITHTYCMFIPTCSEYTKEAVFKYGTVKGCTKGFLRICHCHPWQKKQYDPLI